jgi:radical SAM protein with 4Fe4S-binding SPASM domain
MDNIKKVEFNKTYVIEDIFSTGLTAISNLKKLINIENRSNENEEINCFFGQLIEKKTSNIYILSLECLKIWELILYLKTNYKERTNDKIFPFCFYIRKTLNNSIIFIPLNKNVRQLLFGLYGCLYNNVNITKGFLYGFDCKYKELEIYKTDIPSEKFMNILKNLDENVNSTLNYNCMVCKKKVVDIKQCSTCKWAIFCSDNCYKDNIYKSHISDELFSKNMKYYNELKL